MQNKVYIFYRIILKVIVVLRKQQPTINNGKTRQRTTVTRIRKELNLQKGSLYAIFH